MPQGVDELKNMTPFDLFKSQLETGSTELKVDAMKRMSVVAIAMGKDATLKQLIPYTTNNVAMKQPPQEDEVLMTLAEQLQALVPNLLKESNDVGALLPPLERLLAVEETVLRDAAVRCMNHIVPYVKGNNSALVSLATRLVGADWFTAKVSAANILPVIVAQTKDQDLRFLFKELCNDETPMVRRAAAQNLGKFMLHLKMDKVQDMVPLLQQLSTDTQDSVRLLAVQSLADANFADSPAFTARVFMPLLKSGSTDMSWRVRHNLAKCFSQVAINLGQVQDKSLVMACFVALLQDQEPEVRAAAVAHLARMVAWGGQSLFSAQLQPVLPTLADDVVMEVRSKTALALMDAAEGGTLDDSVILEAFSHHLENFLQDEYPEVQLHVLQNLGRISHLLTEMSGVVSTILNMSKATNWRVRQGVAQLLPHLAEARGMAFFASVLLEPAWLQLLLDPVAQVRQACVDGMPLLCKVAGPDWILHQLVLPHHVRIYNQASQNYLIRMTILQCHAKMGLCGSDLMDEAASELIRALNDRVPNVRMMAAKGLKMLCTSDVATNDLVAKVRPQLEQKISEEPDADCRHQYELCVESF
jgi:serine/threonine-protein phosphatase 2A regulatory subunit A